MPEVDFDSAISFRLVQFNPRRAFRKVPAAKLDCGDQGWLWMTKRDIELNIIEFGRHPELLKALECYKTPSVEFDA